MRILRLLALTAFLASSAVTLSVADKVTVDPNAAPRQQADSNKPFVAYDPAADSDPRMAVKVSYEAVGVRLSDVVAGISKKTGVSILCGSSKNDWRCRDIPMALYVKDVPLGVLLRGIASAAHCLLVKQKTDRGLFYSIRQDAKLNKFIEDHPAKKAAQDKAQFDWHWDVARRLHDIPEEKLDPVMRLPGFVLHEGQLIRDDAYPAFHAELQRKLSALLATLGPEYKKQLDVTGGFSFTLATAPATSRQHLAEVLRMQDDRLVRLLAAQPTPIVIDPATDEQLVAGTFEVTGTPSSALSMTTGVRGHDLHEPMGFLRLRVANIADAAGLPEFPRFYDYPADASDDSCFGHVVVPQPDRAATEPQAPPPGTEPDAASDTEPDSASDVVPEAVPDAASDAMLDVITVTMGAPLCVVPGTKADLEPLSRKKDVTWSEILIEAAKQTGASIVVEDWRYHKEPQSYETAFCRKDVALGQLMACPFAEVEWSGDAGSQLYVGRCRDWTKPRLSLLPAVLYNGLLKKAGAGGLELADVLPLAGLSDEQYHHWIDESRELQAESCFLLGCRRHPIVKFAAALSPDDIALAASDEGLPLASLEPVQVSALLHTLKTRYRPASDDGKPVDPQITDADKLPNMVLRIRSKTGPYPFWLRRDMSAGFPSVRPPALYLRTSTSIQIESSRAGDSRVYASADGPKVLPVYTHQREQQLLEEFEKSAKPPAGSAAK